MDREGFSSLQV